MNSLNYCSVCMELFDWFDSFSKLRKCFICKKKFCEKCIKKTRQKFLFQYLISICNNCFDELN